MPALARWWPVAALALSASAADPTVLRRLDLVATDKAGQPVPDLRAEEILLRDGKANQTIRAFRKRSTPGAMAVVLDLLHWTPLSQRENAWDQTVSAIRKLEGELDVYLYVLTPPAGALIAVRPLPATEAEASAPDPDWVDRLVPQFTALKKAVRPPPSGVHTDADYWAGEIVISRLALLPGRKTLVWIGSVGPRAGGGPRSLELLGRMYRGDIGEYAVWMTADPPPGDDGFRDFGPPSTGRMRAHGEIAETIQAAAAEARQSYRLWYDVPAPHRDLEPHDLRITCKRRGVKLLAPTGFYLMPEDADPVVRRQLLLDRAVNALRDLDDIPVRYLPASAELSIDPSALILRENGGKLAGTLVLRFVSYVAPELRKEVRGDPMTVDLKLARADYDRALRDGLRLPVRVPPDPAALRRRLIVCDPAAELCGSVTMMAAP